MTEGRRVWLEIIVLYLATLVAIRLVVAVVPVDSVLRAAVPILFMYTPVWMCRLRGADPWDYPMALPSFREVAPWLEAARWAVLLSAAVFVPFVVGYHYWQTVGVPWLQDLLGARFYPHLGDQLPELAWTWPQYPLRLVFTHLFFVAIPEEMFYRGYVQTRLDELYPPRWRVFGTMVGPGLLFTCVLFAFGHSIVVLQWWHVFIVVPSLAFGWLRARTGGILAGALFHAWCNITVTTLDTLYGIVPPDL